MEKPSDVRGGFGTILSILFTFMAPAAQLPYLIQLDHRALRHRAVSRNFATALAEARGKSPGRYASQNPPRDSRRFRLKANGQIEEVASRALQAGDRVPWKLARSIPGDGEIVAGVASVDEFRYHRRIGPRHPRGRRRPNPGVTGGTRVLSDRIVVKITASAGKSFLDRMIAWSKGRAAAHAQRNSRCRSCYPPSR